jgi:hypothetical protein
MAFLSECQVAPAACNRIIGCGSIECVALDFRLCAAQGVRFIHDFLQPRDVLPKLLPGGSISVSDTRYTTSEPSFPSKG